MRFGAMMAGGVVGLVAVKVITALFLPVVGAAVALLLMGLKALFWLAIGYAVYRVLFRRRRRDRAEV